MTEETILTLGTQSLKTIVIVASPMLIAALVIGILVSIFQAITQINEATLTFIPKMMIVALVILLMGPLMLDQLKGFTIEVFESVGTIVRTQ
jgi:flagellar biosynthetic protein FliQ